MKNKPSAKRLKFNKETIAHLNGKQMRVIKGKGEGETCPWMCEWDITVPANCSGGGTAACPTDGCGTNQSECASVGQEWCTTMPEDTCC